MKKGTDEHLEVLFRKFAGLLVPLTVRCTTELTACARRGDVAGIRIWQTRGAEWKGVAARIRAITSTPQADATPEMRATLASELTAATSMIDRWSEPSDPTERRS